MPLRRRSGEFFGTLCALDPDPTEIPEKSFEIFHLLAELLSWQLQQEELHEERAVALLDAQETAELRERFIAVLGHDLRNPLHAVLFGGQTLLRSTNLSLSHLRTAQRIVASAERINRMISDLLDFARGRLGGGMPIQARPHDARQLLEDIISEMEPAFPSRRIELDAACADVSVEWDQDRMAQVFSNLLSNALEHSPEDARVRVSLRTYSESIEVEVHNDGAPIPPEVLPHIFTPFRRGGEGRGHSRDGLGLGLYIARQVVLAHRGTLEVCSSVESGTQFTVRVPRGENQIKRLPL